ncbi:MAG: hypothetical protein DRH08_00185 [Deltaproteobacteria bacterium]|nr:MAG: hypothetical protein DRH08_00185 [Deltaproteobacteria bacterium]
MSTELSPMGRTLNYLMGTSKTGEGPIEVKTRVIDFNVITMTAPNGQAQHVPASTLISLTADSFREVDEGSDVWEFRVTGEKGERQFLYFAGADLLTVRAASKVL